MPQCTPRTTIKNKQIKFRGKSKKKKSVTSKQAHAKMLIPISGGREMLKLKPQ
jgi:hypothetical protein